MMELMDVCVCMFVYLCVCSLSNVVSACVSIIHIYIYNYIYIYIYIYIYTNTFTIAPHRVLHDLNLYLVKCHMAYPMHFLKFPGSTVTLYPLHSMRFQLTQNWHNSHWLKPLTLYLTCVSYRVSPFHMVISMSINKNQLAVSPWPSYISYLYLHGHGISAICIDVYGHGISVICISMGMVYVSSLCLYGHDIYELSVSLWAWYISYLYLHGHGICGLSVSLWAWYISYLYLYGHDISWQQPLTNLPWASLVSYLLEH